MEKRFYNGRGIILVILFIMYPILEEYTKSKERIPYWKIIHILLTIIVLFAETKSIEWINYIFYIILLVAFSLLFLSSTDGINANDLKDRKQTIILLPFLGLTTIIGTCSAFSMIPVKSLENNFGLGLIGTIILSIPIFINFWKLIHISDHLYIILVTSIVNILALEFTLYLGLGITVSPEKLIGTVLTEKSLVDNIVLLLNIGIGAVVQFPSIENGILPSTRMTLAYCTGNMINFIVASFYVAYIVSMISELKDKDGNPTCLGINFKK